MYKKKNKYAGDNIKMEKGSWSFNKNVAKNFDKHINKSVPLYSEGHNLILEYSDFFLNEKSLCYDIGCSTGSLLNLFGKKFYNKNIKFIGIENEKHMFIKAKEKVKKYKNISIRHCNINNIKLKKSDLIISYYTMQFIQPKIRQDLFNKIYDSLNWGGALILFEKVRSPDARFQDINNQIYNEFKLNNGYSPDEIINKSLSLKGVLEPFSYKGNIDLLTRSGFKDITTILKFISFEGFLVIK